MDSMEVNKACAAVLVAGITFMVAGLIGDGLVHPKRLETARDQDRCADRSRVGSCRGRDPPVAVELRPPTRPRAMR